MIWVLVVVEYIFIVLALVIIKKRFIEYIDSRIKKHIEEMEKRLGVESNN